MQQQEKVGTSHASPNRMHAVAQTIPFTPAEGLPRDSSNGSSIPHKAIGRTLVVTIPALNERATIGRVIQAVPREIAGIDAVKILVVSDGSTDGTEEVAVEAGADLVYRFARRQGLAKVYKTGLAEALKLGADVIVNIDADGQYVAEEMHSLVAPIVTGTADVVLGSRLAGRIEEMPRSKRIGNQFGTWVVRQLSGVPITDAHTGYRALNRHAALSLNVLSDYTYTQETILQAGFKKLQVVEIPVTFNRRSAGQSRLVSSFFRFGSKAAMTVGKMTGSRHAFGYMLILGVLSILIGLGIGAKVIVHFVVTGQVSPFLPSAILSGFGIVFGLQLVVLALIASMSSDSRTLLEDLLYVIKDRGR